MSEEQNSHNRRAHSPYSEREAKKPRTELLDRNSLRNQINTSMRSTDTSVHQDSKSSELDKTIPTKIFVGGISWSSTEEGLKSYFDQYGEVTLVDLMRNRADNQPRGFGFITFKDSEGVSNAVAKRMHEIDGKQVEVKRAFKKNDDIPSGVKTNEGPLPCKLFVGGITPDTKESDLEDHFAKFGQLVSAVVMMDSQTNRGRGFGFVTFEKKEDADEVLAEPEHMVNGKLVDVKSYKQRGNNEKKSNGYGVSHGGMGYTNRSYGYGNYGGAGGGYGMYGYGNMNYGGYGYGGTPYAGGGYGGGMGYEEYNQGQVQAGGQGGYDQNVQGGGQGGYDQNVQGGGYDQINQSYQEYDTQGYQQQGNYDQSKDDTQQGYAYGNQGYGYNQTQSKSAQSNSRFKPY